jgi:hypothetical protein
MMYAALADQQNVTEHRGPQNTASFVYSMKAKLKKGDIKIRATCDLTATAWKFT